MAHERLKIRYSVRQTFLTIMLLFIVIMAALLNIYPTISSRDLVFSTKQTSMVGQVTVMSTSLSVLETLTEENVASVMELVDVNSFDRVLVTDGSGCVIYDTWEEGAAVGSTALFSEVFSALAGSVVFNCRYNGDAFISRVATPVVASGETIGVVYLSEYDSSQALLIAGIQSRLLSFSLILSALAVVAVVIITTFLTGRIRELVCAMRRVRGGDYDTRTEPRGCDEVTELAEEFNDMTVKIQNTTESRRRFVSDASHELRTPLASIRLLSDSIVQNEDMSPDTAREFAADISSEAERLQRLTEKLLKLSRMDSSAETPRERVDVKTVAERTIHLLTPLASQRDVRVTTELAEGCFITANEDDIYQIIFNLAENAVKYNVPNGSVLLRLYAQDGRVVLTVEDTGIGIPEEDLPNVFSRFYRVDKARSRAAGGNGLGLSIVHDAVTLHGGEISIAPREGGGTCFTVSFPLAPPEGGEGNA